ncbi:MAG: ATP synthase subunit I [Oscillospiraceae bacterium]|nr:ATP synthase subunit I [Oscillospiraceae bacterium]MBQ5749355.1 ATP synthase subunit I [Oscillospiraceae bacterium]
MKLTKSIRTELTFLALGLLACACAICAVFALLHRFDYTVALGALWGSIFAWLRIFLLAVQVQKLADCTDDSARAIAQNRLRASYFVRMIVMVFAIVVGIIVPFLHYIAVLLPFLLAQPVLMLRRAIVSRQEKRQKEADA